MEQRRYRVLMVPKWRGDAPHSFATPTSSTPVWSIELAEQLLEHERRLDAEREIERERELKCDREREWELTRGPSGLIDRLERLHAA